MTAEEKGEQLSAGGIIPPGFMTAELDFDECILDDTTWHCVRGGEHRNFCVDRLMEEPDW